MALYYSGGASRPSGGRRRMGWGGHPRRPVKTAMTGRGYTPSTPNGGVGPTHSTPMNPPTGGSTGVYTGGGGVGGPGVIGAGDEVIRRDKPVARFSYSR